MKIQIEQYDKKIIVDIEGEDHYYSKLIYTFKDMLTVLGYSDDAFKDFIIDENEEILLADSIKEDEEDEEIEKPRSVTGDFCSIKLN